MNYSPTRFVSQANVLFWVVVELFLVVRFVMRFFAANPSNGFVHWVYVSTDALLAPLHSVFPVVVVSKSHVVDFPVLFAMLFYAVLAVLIAAVVRWLDSVATKKVARA